MAEHPYNRDRHIFLEFDESQYFSYFDLFASTVRVLWSLIFLPNFTPTEATVLHT